MSIITVSVVLPAGQAVSNAIDCSVGRIARIIMPSDWTGAAPLTFCVSPDNTIFHDLYHTAAETYATNEVIIPTVTPNSAVVMPPDAGSSFNWLKIRSGTHASPVVQAADRVFQFAFDTGTGVGTGAPGPAGPVGPVGPAGPAGPQGIHGDPAAPALLQTVVLGHAKGVNYNVIGDTAIAIAAAKYAITQLVTFNNVGGADNYTGSLRDAAGGAGTDLGGYAYNTDGQLGDWSDFPGPLPISVAPTLYFHVGTKEGAPATGDLYVMGYDLTGL